jgi:glucokinase
MQHDPGQPVAALDLGGSHVSAARVALRTASTEAGSASRTSFSPDAGREELLGALCGAAASIAHDVALLGVAAPGPFDYERGVCLVEGLGKLEAVYGVDLGRELRDALDGGVTVTFLNDAEAFLLGEAWAGVARGHARVVGVTLGTGLGSAFLADGAIVADGPSVPPDGSLHLAPFRGAPVEDVISARALHARHGAAVAELARRREQRVFDELGADLGAFLAPWLDRFGASCLVVGGSIANAWDLFGPALERALAPVPGLEVVARAANLDDAPLLGAALDAATRAGVAVP